VTLTNSVAGAAGNVAITKTVQSIGFAVAGMSGGAGADCPADTGCGADTDCLSGHCDMTAHLCKAATCGDGTKNGSETDIDCGGSCAQCVDGRSCLIGADCLSLSCSGNKCIAPRCDDGIANQGESDIDCGGPCAALVPAQLCAVGQSCTGGGDCASGLCDSATKTCQLTFKLDVSIAGTGSVASASTPAGVAGGVQRPIPQQ
jgi:hypothetical protein